MTGILHRVLLLFILSFYFANYAEAKIKLTKPVYVHHTFSQPYGLEWNKDYSQSLGISYYLHDNDSISLTYVEKNSFYKRSIYAHYERAALFYENSLFDIRIGAAIGTRSGYKREQSQDNSFKMSGAFKFELQPKNSDIEYLINYAPENSGIFIFSISKYF